MIVLQPLHPNVMTKQKGEIIHYSDANKAYLEQRYKENPTPTLEQCLEYAQAIKKDHLPEAGAKVHKWFTRRRSKVKDIEAQGQFTMSPPNRSESSGDSGDLRTAREDSILSIGSGSTSTSESDDDGFVVEAETPDIINIIEKKYIAYGMKIIDGDQEYRTFRKYIQTWKTPAGRRILTEILQKTVDNEVLLRFGKDEKFLYAIKDFLTSLMKDLTMDLTAEIHKNLYLEVALQMLKVLERLPIPVDVVQSSKIGVFVNNKLFKGVSIESISQTARNLLQKWTSERRSAICAPPVLSSATNIKPGGADKKRPATRTSVAPIGLKRQKVEGSETSISVKSSNVTTSTNNNSSGIAGPSISVTTQPIAHKPNEAAQAALRKLRLSGLQAPLKKTDNNVMPKHSPTDASTTVKPSSLFDQMAKEKAEKVTALVPQKRSAAHLSGSASSTTQSTTSVQITTPPLSELTAAAPERHDGTVIPPRPEGMSRKEWLKRYKIRIYFPAQDSLLRKIQLIQTEDDGEEHKHHASLREAERGEFVKGNPIEEEDELTYPSADYTVRPYQVKGPQNSPKIYSEERAIQEKRVQNILMTTYYHKSEIPTSPHECLEPSEETVPLWERPTPSIIPLPVASAMPSTDISSQGLPNEYRPISLHANSTKALIPTLAGSNNIAASTFNSNNVSSFSFSPPQSSITTNSLVNTSTQPSASTSFLHGSMSLPTTTISLPLVSSYVPTSAGSVAGMNTRQEESKAGTIKLSSLLSSLSGGVELRSLLSNPLLVPAPSQAPSHPPVMFSANGQPITPPPAISTMVGSAPNSYMGSTNMFGTQPSQPASWSTLSNLLSNPPPFGNSNMSYAPTTSNLSTTPNSMSTVNMPAVDPQRPNLTQFPPAMASSSNAFGLFQFGDLTPNSPRDVSKNEEKHREGGRASRLKSDHQKHRSNAGGAKNSPPSTSRGGKGAGRSSQHGPRDNEHKNRLKPKNLKKKNRPCDFWNGQQGSCRRENDCEYLHSDPKTDRDVRDL